MRNTALGIPLRRIRARISSRTSSGTLKDMQTPARSPIGLRPAPGRRPPLPSFFFFSVIGYSFLHYYITNTYCQTTVTAAMRRLRSIINPETAFTKYSNIQFLQSIQRLQCHHLRLSKLHKVLYNRHRSSTGRRAVTPPAVGRPPRGVSPHRPAPRRVSAQNRASDRGRVRLSHCRLQRPLYP